MLPLETVGMHTPSYSLSATCVLLLLADCPLRTHHTKIGPDDLLFNLVFFSTFEELNLPIHGPMEDAEVMKLC